MDNMLFINTCIELVKNYVLEHLEITDNVQFNENNIYVVWLNKTLQNNKALLSTTLPDGMYYEVTYNGDKNEFYLDAYKKFENKCYKGYKDYKGV